MSGITSTSSLTGYKYMEVQNKTFGRILWLTGLSGSGKTSLSQSLRDELEKKNIMSYTLDGDIMRKGLCSDLGFSPEDRKENIRRIGEVAKLFLHINVLVIVAFISPYREDRDFIRQSTEDGQFIEIFVDCPLEECEERDLKGLYKKARAGEISMFTGVSAPYEQPVSPEVHLKTNEYTIDECTQQIIEYLKEQQILES